jgi:glyoxylase-like metal-dependent hydrolase (beta-lactamase superfamily II)
MDLVPDMAEVMKLAYDKRIRYLDGDEQIAPGIRVVLVGGHSPGSQVVVVTTRKGEAVICSDALDLYRNLEEGVVAPGADLLQGLLAWDRIKALASSPELIIPSHDPLVLKKFPNPFEGIAEIA